MADSKVFADADLSGARFVRSDLSGAVMRAVDIEGAEIDAPWLLEGDGGLRVNGVDVIPLVEAELNRRFPGRAARRATTPDGLRAAWAGVEATWAATLVGEYANSVGVFKTLVESWNGAKWSLVPSPNPASSHNAT